MTNTHAHAIAGVLLAALVACGGGGAPHKERRTLTDLGVSIELPANYTFDAKAGIYAVATPDRQEVAMITTWEAGVPSPDEAKSSCDGTGAQVDELTGGGRMISCMAGAEAMARAWVPRGAGVVMCLAHRGGAGALAEVRAICASLAPV